MQTIKKDDFGRFDIAATALENNLTIVTKNMSDFQNLGVELFDPTK